MDMTNSSVNGNSCNNSYMCGSASLQGVLTPEQVQIIGSYTGPIPTYNNGVQGTPNIVNTNGLTATTTYLTF